MKVISSEHQADERQQQLTATNMRYRLYNADTLNRYAKDCHKRAIDKGFWDEPHGGGHYLMLSICELSEAVEADRIGKWAKLDPATIDTLEQMEGAPYAQMFLSEVKDTVEDEISDAVIRLFDLLGHIRNGGEIPSYDVNTARSTYENNEPPAMLTEAFMPIISTLCDGFLFDYRTRAVLYAIKSLEQLCDHLGIDLMTHIELKMKYNATRPALHGKKY